MAPAALFIESDLRIGRLFNGISSFGSNILLYITNGMNILISQKSKRLRKREETMRGRQISRRSVLKGSLMASVIGGTGSFFGPWEENHAWGHGGPKPIKLGLTCDASGQYGNSGQDDFRGIKMAI